jgi:hypothetical protein
MDDDVMDTGGQLDLRKQQLEVEKLALEVAAAKRLRRYELVLQLMPSLTIIVTVLGFAFTVWQYTNEQSKSRQAAEQQAIRDAEASQREFMKPLLDKQQQLYFEAATAAATFATSPDPKQRRDAENTFWALYWGPLVMVESTEVSGVMMAFGRCVSGEEMCTNPEVRNRSLKLASTLEQSILKTWNTKPEEFIKGQFVYR